MTDDYNNIFWWSLNLSNINFAIGAFRSVCYIFCFILLEIHEDKTVVIYFLLFLNLYEMSFSSLLQRLFFLHASKLTYQKRYYFYTKAVCKTYLTCNDLLYPISTIKLQENGWKKNSQNKMSFCNKVLVVYIVRWRHGNIFYLHINVNYLHYF